MLEHTHYESTQIQRAHEGEGGATGRALGGERGHVGWQVISADKLENRPFP